MSNASTVLTVGSVGKVPRQHQVGHHCLVIAGHLLRIAQLRQELYYEIDTPEHFIKEAKAAKVPADIFTFLHQFPQDSALHPYQMEWDNFAAIPVTTYDDWSRSLPKQTRRGLRKAAEAGVEVRLTELNDDFIRGVGEILNENPIRQGKRFWHYGKTFEQVREMMLMDFNRARFLGAYCHGELIGFIKLLSGRNFERTSLILSKFAHRSKYTNNAMVAKALEICVSEGTPFLIYGQIDYGKVGNKSLADFKLNNGFKMLPLARYYVPLNTRGAIALRIGLHHGPLALIPKPIVQGFLRTRGLWRTKKTSAVGTDGQDT